MTMNDSGFSGRSWTYGRRRRRPAAAATGDGWRGDGDRTTTQTSKYGSKKARRVPWGGAQTPPRNAPKRSPRTPPWESPKGGPWTSPGGGLWTPAGGVFCNPVGAALGAPRGPQVAPSGPQEGSRRASWEPVRPSTHVQNASWGSFGRPLKASSAVLEVSGAVLGVSGAVLEVLGGSLELSWSVRSSKTLENTGKPKTS